MRVLVASAFAVPYTIAMNTHTSDIKAWLSTGSINIFGRPFAGKDTQGKRLAALLDGSLLGGGDILRNTETSPELAAIRQSGKLIPSDAYVDIVLPFLKKPEFAGRPLILSSVGRWIGEEVGVMRALEEADHPLKAVVYLDIPPSDVRQRWHALEHHDDRHNRADDTLEILERRLDEYQQKTIPVIDKYEQLGLLLRIDGTGTPDEVYSAIIGGLAMRARQS
ncbi:hypothetical protein CR983_01780 [Candidatus Saccharibacteria bacterium]|nr:MAG: hypothetical protein CR983_01780 [Candidatus Saccharibacteria bacterium]